MDDNKNNQVVSLGCRLNIFESEVIKNNLSKSGVKNTIVVNTCTVTQQAHKQSMQMVRKLRRSNPNSKIIVTGCGAQIDFDGYNKMPEVNKVIDNYNKLSIGTLLGLENHSNTMNSSLSSIYDNKELFLENKDRTMEIPKIQGFSSKTKAFIQIQQGCDHRCTFCIISKARGRSKSLSIKDIISQVQQAVSFGHKDVTLTGVDISSWSYKDSNHAINTKSYLGELCIKILKDVPDLSRLRLSSLDPAVQDNEILWLLKNEERFMPHLHLSLQSLHDTVLKNMGRRHTNQSALEWINKIRNANPNVTLGADIIAGFPKETESQHLYTYETLKKFQIPFLHVFPYSERSGTVAAKMRSIPLAVRKQRAKELIALGNQIKLDLLFNKIGSTVEVLVEGKNMGYTKDYCLCKIQNTNVSKKDIITAKVVGVEDYKLILNYL